MGTNLREKLVCGLIITLFLFPISVAENGYRHCDCMDEGFWNVDSIVFCQKLGDFLIAIAYFSIPIELLYFLSCSNVPFKWVLVQFVAFIVLCGMTHLLNTWTYGPHTFQLMFALTIFKFLTALVSFATAITLVTLIPMLLKVKVREFMLKKKTWDLGREVRNIKKKREAGWHVRMLTQEIRKSLDRHTILYTTLVELSKTLDLQNCALWMPNEQKTELHLIHELKPGANSSIAIDDVDVRTIKQNGGVKLLEPDSILVSASSGGAYEVGSGAGIRIPILKVSNFKGGTPELVPFCYAVLVSVLPGGQGRYWGNQDLDILRVVADQVAVALSHASILEESQNMRDRLVDQNRALQQAKQDAMLASQARVSFQKVMSDGMRGPLHSVLGLVSMIKDEDNLNPEQENIVSTMERTGKVISTLVSDMMEISTRDSGRFPLEVGPFGLHSMVREATCVAHCLCLRKGYGFIADVDNLLPNEIVGDEKRVFQVILHMIGNLLRENSGGGRVILRVQKESGSQGLGDQRWQAWRTNSNDGYVTVKFEIGINNYSLEGLVPNVKYVRKYKNQAVEQGLSFSVCKKLVQLMQGNIWIVPDPNNFDQSMALVLRFQIWPSILKSVSEKGESSECTPQSLSLFRGLEVLLAMSDDTSRGVTKKLLQKLGCTVTIVKSGIECLGSLGSSFSDLQVVILDLNLPDLDGADVAMRIRKFRSRNWPLIIGLTDSGDEEVIEKCFENGINGVIQKPVILKQVADELRKVLSLANK